MRPAGQVPIGLPAQLEKQRCLHAETSVPDGEGPLRFSEEVQQETVAQ